MNGSICKSRIDITYLELFSHYIQLFSRLAIASWIYSYNVMTKDMIYNRTDALKTDVNLFFVKSVGRSVSQALEWYYALLKFSKQAKWWRIFIVFINKLASSPIQMQVSTLLHVHFVFRTEI